MSMAEPRWLTDEQQRAWRAYRRMQTILPAMLAHDLWRETGLSDPDYDVLSTLSETPSHSWRLRELAAKMLWSRSRLSHHISRMERRGLVQREGDPDDARGCMIVLTDAGMQTLVEAAPSHVESVREHFIDLLSEGDVKALREISERVVAHINEI